MGRKWNGVGSIQMSVIHMVGRSPRTQEQLQEKFGESILLTLSRLINRGLIGISDGKYHITDHGKMIQKAPEIYKKWKERWGLS